jgi:predicted SprT family Zn-dependent metalloprotease
MSGQLDFFTRLLAKVLPPAARPDPVPNLPRSGTDPALTAQCAGWLSALGYGELAAQVRVVWSHRMRTTAGLAYPAKALIKLNPRIRQFGEVEVDHTLRHELAHLLAHHRVGRRRISPHGPEWRKACADLGLPDEERCHNLPLPRREMARPHIYRCPQCRVEIRRVRPMRRPSACLACCRRHANGRYDERFRFIKA